MAAGLKWWLAALIGGCGLIALAFLPPRGVPAERDAGAWLTPWGPGSAGQRRVRELSLAWRSAQRALLAAEYRDSVERRLARRPRESRTPVLIIATRMPAADREALAAAFDSVGRRVAPSPATAVALVIIPDTLRRLPGRPRPEPRLSPLYLVPSAPGHAACVVLLPERHRAVPGGRIARVSEWLTHGLGPCAYYAAFGRPGHALEQWLRGRRLDLAYGVDWAGAAPGLGRPRYQDLRDLPSWYLGVLYANARFEAIACAGGRAPACRAELLRATERRPGDDLGDAVATDYWWLHRSLEGAASFLSDLVEAHGRDRFAQFWRSEQSVDSAFAAAFGEPLGDWTVRWQRGMLPTLPLGPGVPPDAAGLTLLVAGLVVAATLLYVRRRQVA